MRDAFPRSSTRSLALDFRAPLTAINGYYGLLIGGQLGPLTDEQKEVLRRMQYSAKRLSRMAEGMFQLSAGRNAETRPKLQRGDIECNTQTDGLARSGTDRQGTTDQDLA